MARTGNSLVAWRKIKFLYRVGSAETILSYGPEESADHEELRIPKMGTKVEDGFPTVNRYAMVLRPKRGLLAWLQSQPDADPKWNYEYLLATEQNVYLLPEIENGLPEELKRWLRRNFRPFFGEELRAWYRMESCWPSERSFSVFSQFFEPVFHTLVFDAGKEELHCD